MSIVIRGASQEIGPPLILPLVYNTALSIGMLLLCGCVLMTKAADQRSNLSCWFNSSTVPDGARVEELSKDPLMPLVRIFRRPRYVSLETSLAQFQELL